jgi:Antibiotic biosynthesis monooxygenase
VTDEKGVSKSSHELKNRGVSFGFSFFGFVKLWPFRCCRKVGFASVAMKINFGSGGKQHHFLVAAIVLLMLSHFVTPVRSFATRQVFLLTTTRGGAKASLAFSSSTTTTKMAPFAVVVEAEIEPDRMAEFLEMIKTNAENSRKEPGCIRFGA